MQLRKSLTFLISFLVVPMLIMAQVTTSSITGIVNSDKGEKLEGATIIAIHTPTGTKYATTSQKNGNFTLPNTLIGGPYKVTIGYVGYSPKVIDDIILSLGVAFDASSVLSNSPQDLTAVIITSTAATKKISSGTSTVINSRVLGTMPTISRSITDFTRLTPQSNGNSFAGRDGRFNNLQIDGANLNNNFGLSTDPLPGGGASPISLDALDEVSVNIAPYDVRQSGFTGAGLNINTKSGTNTFHGTVYGYYSDSSFVGKKLGKETLKRTDQKNKIFGGSIGGPIIKNKLFFFLNFESENKAIPAGSIFKATGAPADAIGILSAAPHDHLVQFRDALLSKYNYSAGEIGNLKSTETKNRKFIAKLNWNISTKHKLVLKYSDFSGSDQSPINGSSIPNSGAGGIKIGGPSSSSITRLPNNRNSIQALSFSNSDYGTDHIVKSGTLELNSNFSSKISNQLLVSYTHINDRRNSVGAVFPTIDIFDGDSTVAGVTNLTNYMSSGTDPFTRINDIVNNIATVTDNFTYFANKHTLTTGVSYEFQKVGNAFMPASGGYYAYNTLKDFINDAPPRFYSYTYSLVPGEEKVFSANLKLGQLGVYIQDEFSPSKNLKLTYGIRGDIPTYLEQPIENKKISELNFPDKDGNMKHFSTGKWPDAKLLLSPRVGVRWNVPDVKNLIVRGGLGIFTGKIPFVFLTNMPSNSGVYQNSVVLNTTSQLASIKFNPNHDAYRSLFPDSVKTAPGSFVLIDPKFKFPQVFRANFGLDKQLGSGFTATVDLLFTKDINAVVMRNANLIAPTEKLTGLDNRSYYPSTTTASQKFVNPNIAGPNKGGTIVILENNNKGYSFNSTFQLSKSFSKGFYGSLAYSYTLATEVSPNPGYQATSAWQSIANVGTPNNIEVYNSQYAVPHRVVGNISYRLEYLKHAATTVSFFYEGSSQGRFSYVIQGDINNDGNNASDLMFIYAKGSDVPFVDIMSGTTVKYSIADQQAAYDKFVSKSKYLSKYKGQYAERNGAIRPWFNRVDARILQDLFLKTGKHTHALQLSLDIFNFTNLIDKSAGATYTPVFNNILTSTSSAGNSSLKYTLREFNGALVSDPFIKTVTAISTWSMQVGIRYKF